MAWESAPKLKRLGHPGYRNSDGGGDGGCCRWETLLFEQNVFKYSRIEKKKKSVLILLLHLWMVLV